MLVAADSPCTVWATDSQVRLLVPAVQSANEYPAARIVTWLETASAWLYRASGRRYPGVCVATVRPVGRCTGTYGRSYAGGAFWFDSRTGRHGWGNHVSGRAEGVSEVTLGYYPLRAVTEVKIDGTNLSGSAYRVDDHRYLVRIDGDPWPSAQDLALPTTDVGTWQVTLRHGADPPADGAAAAAILAGELALANAGKDCRLPKRVTSITRQGVTAVILDPMDVLDRGRFGIPEVDAFIASVNPHGIARRAGVASPDIGRAVRVAGTGS